MQGFPQVVEIKDTSTTVQGIGDGHDSHTNMMMAPIGVHQQAYTKPEDENWLNTDEWHTQAPGHQLHCHCVKRQNTGGLGQLDSIATDDSLRWEHVGMLVIIDGLTS